MLSRSPNLTELRADYERAYRSLLALIDSKFPGCNAWNWYRALHAVKGEQYARNDDTTHDAALAADTDIEASHAEFIRLLHVFYKARDGVAWPPNATAWNASPTAALIPSSSRCNGSASRPWRKRWKA